MSITLQPNSSDLPRLCVCVLPEEDTKADKLTTFSSCQPVSVCICICICTTYTVLIRSCNVCPTNLGDTVSHSHVTRCPLIVLQLFIHSLAKLANTIYVSFNLHFLPLVVGDSLKQITCIITSAREHGAHKRSHTHCLSNFKVRSHMHDALSFALSSAQHSSVRCFFARLHLPVPRGELRPISTTLVGGWFR